MIVDIENLIKKITDEIKTFTDFAVVGLSGGVDSLCVATLSMLALGKENVLAVHMPHNEMDLYDDLKFNGNSMRIAKKLDINSVHIPIGAISETLNVFVEKAIQGPLSQVNEGNSRSRTRMCILYALAHQMGDQGKRARVMGTGNMSEDFIGYDTKGGDALADIFPIGELFKSEVYQLADYFVEKGYIDADMIDRKPSAGLWDGQTDEEELGYSYNQMEPIIKVYLNDKDRLYDKELMTEKSSILSKTELGEFVLNRHLNNKHKHEAPPVIRLRGTKYLE